MNALLLASLLVIQGLANSIQTPTGVITGTIRLSNGDPAVYVRVAAMRAPETGAGDTTADAGALFSQTQTDEAGRYRLEGIPPGQYFVVAGRLNDPTFFARGAKAEPASVSISSGVPIDNIDFTIADSSARPPDPLLDPLLSLVLTQVRIRVMTDDGGPIPVASPTGRLLLRVTGASPGAGLPPIGTLLPAQYVTVQRLYVLGASASLSPAGNGSIRNDGSGEIFVGPGDYRLSLANLPDKYEVRAITYNGVDALTLPVRIVASGDVRVVVGLKKVAPPRTGLAVRGRVLDALSGTSATAESVRLSQLPGSLFSDGTYEFTNVVPGSHLLEVFEGQPGDRTANVEVAVGNADVVVNATYTTRPAAVEVTGRFVVEGGGTFNDARVLTGSGQTAVVAAPDGTFMMTLREGEYPLAFSVSPVGFMVKSITFGSTQLSERKLLIDGAKGAIAPELAVTLAPMPRVRLHVRVSATQPTTRSVAGAHVTLSGPERHQTTLGADGAFELPVLPGEYRLEIHPFGFTSIRESISVKPGSDISLVFTSIPLY